MLRDSLVGLSDGLKLRTVTVGEEGSRATIVKGIGGMHKSFFL